MIYHTNKLKNEISKMGRQIKSKVTFYVNPYIITENRQDIISENGDKIITEIDQTPGSQAVETYEIPEENIYSIDIIKNGSLLKSLMKQCNIEMKDDFNIGDVFNVQLGILVESNYEYLNYGNYIIYSKEYNINNNTWRYICYDKMLWAMVKYTRLNVEYPITVRDYINAIANRMGVLFANANSEFTNYNELIKEDYFKDKEVTYRDILDKLAEITASNIVINYEQLQVKYPLETNDIIDENNIKNVNTNFGKQFGFINQVEITNKENNLYYLVKDDTSIEQNGVNKINILDNPFVFNGNEDSICKNILNRLKEVNYSINDFTTTGVCYYDFLDSFTVSIENKNYKCLLLNNEIKIQQGIKETIFTEPLKNVKSENNSYQNNNLSNKDIQYQVEELNNDKVGRNNIINAINQSKEYSVINSNKMFLTKTINGITDSNGFIDIELDSEYVVICATASFNNSNYGFIIPYYTYENNTYKWYIKIEDKNKAPVSNLDVSITIYYFKNII